MSLSLQGPDHVGHNQVTCNNETIHRSNYLPAKAERAAHARKLRATRGAESFPS